MADSKQITLYRVPPTGRDGNSAQPPSIGPVSLP
jgi:hypothetical protein